MTGYKNWHLETDALGFLWLRFDRLDESANTFNDESLDELNSILLDVGQNPSIKGMIIYSGKSKGFIAGADVRVLSQFKDKDQAMDFIRKGQSVFMRLASLNIPTLAMINGFCMGGGLELVLACRYRIASDEPDTKFALPEVLLGFMPGWGGTARLPRLIGGFNALSQVMLTGAPVSASRAKQLGMVDDVVPLRQLKRAALQIMTTLPAPHKPTFLQSLTNKPGIRTILATIIERKLAQKVKREHYPAPYAIVSLWEKEGAEGERAFNRETEALSELLTDNQTSQNLIRAFLLRERMKSFAKLGEFTGTHVHVVGAGVMGGDIAIWCAYKGYRVTLQDVSYEKIAPVMARAYAFYKKKLKKPRLIQKAMDNLVPDPKGFGIPKADMIIEAVFENLTVKQDLFKSLEEKAKKTAILATNTSSIPLKEIAEEMKHSERLVGIHFFNPVTRMELVEIVSTDKTSKEVIGSACAFVNSIGRLPLPVRSSPGFLVNRVLMPYLMECVQLLEEGYNGEDIDAAALDFGMMMGPVELADTVGMDVCLAVAENLTQHFGGTVPQKLRDMVAAGKLGRKTGEGFYKYRDGKPIKARPNVDKQADIAERLILRIINESSACLREGVVADADLLDAGMIFATGFAPFRGGPMNYAKTLGQENLAKLFKTLETQHGKRFKSDEGLVEQL